MVAPVVLLAIWLIFWLVDSTSQDDKTPRGLKLESAAIPDVSIDIGGLSEDDVADVVVELAERFQQTPIEIATPSQAVTVTAEEVGLAVDVEGTVAAIMALDSDESNPIGWTASFFRVPRAVPS